MEHHMSIRDRMTHRHRHRATQSKEVLDRTSAEKAVEGDSRADHTMDPSVRLRTRMATIPNCQSRTPSRTFASSEEAVVEGTAR